MWISPTLDGILFTRGTEIMRSYPRHWHEEIHFCAHTDGFSYLGHQGKSYLVKDGDFTVTLPGEVHENWVNGSDSGISFRGAYIDMPFFRKAIVQVTGRDGSVPDFRKILLRDELVQQQFLAMHIAVEKADSPLQQEELFLAFLHRLLSRCSTGPLPETRLGREHGAVEQAREYINQHYARSISLASLGQLTNLSPYHLHRVFCKETGMPPHAYQTQVRINRAKQLLRSRHPLSAVALNTGFADQSHLTRHFRRLVGVTPGRFLL